MDLLYSRYRNPLEFMRLYINQGRFGEFVAEILEMDAKRKQEEADKDNEQKMWEMYLHSMADKSFNDWKKDVLSNSNSNQKPVSLSMNDDQVEDAKQKARGILKNFSPL